MNEMEGNYSEHLAPNIADVVNILMPMFGNIMDREAIISIVESCDGNLNNSTEALMQITNDSKVNNECSDAPVNPTPAPCALISPQAQAIHGVPTMSYSSASQSSAAVPKTRTIENNNIRMSTQQCNKIMTYHNNGYRIMIIMRGVSGSGKTHLSKCIVDRTIGSGAQSYRSHIYSADDYFFRGGTYCYDRTQITAAHTWNNKRVRKAVEEGISPIIIDNTNLVSWEMEPYIIYGIKEGYAIELVEPQTPWSGNAYDLFRHNIHNVPLKKIQIMLNKYDKNVTVAQIMNKFNLTYPNDKNPPQLRNTPPFITNQDLSINDSTNPLEVPTAKLIDLLNPYQNVKCLSHDTTESHTCPTEQTPNEIKHTSEHIHQTYVEAEAEYKKVEEEWDMGEKWVTVDSKGRSSDIVNTENHHVPKQKREIKRDILANNNKHNDQFLPIEMHQWNDWDASAKAFSPWDDPSTSSSKIHEVNIKQTSTIGTCMEIGDRANYKVLWTEARDINHGYITSSEMKIPEKRMLDKSSMTNEQMLNSNNRCDNQEKHFMAFRKMFNNIELLDLREIFDQCCGDVNWAVEIVLDGVLNNRIGTKENYSDCEEIEQESCSCAANYNDIPDIVLSKSVNSGETEKESSGVPIKQQTPQRKPKKETTVSESSLLLKKKLEENVVISKHHYSKHCLKIKYRRLGEVYNEDEMHNDSDTSNNTEELLPQDASSQSSENIDNDTGSEDSCAVEDKTISVGFEFINQLDNIFGRKDAKYSKDIVPFLTVPMSLLHKFNALWMESLTHQLETQTAMTDIHIKEDEKLARQLALKEEENLRAVIEPAVPDFKEIMDMDFALSLYHKDASKWKDSEPNDYAARMTREKLYNLFPDMSKDILSEMLVAHDNNFQSTLEVLLMSTGQSHILEQENGINKFIMQKEMAIKEQALAEQKQKLKEEWQVLVRTSEDGDVGMDTVELYREKAKRHLEVSNFNLHRARDFSNRLMFQPAAYYTEVAKLHAQQFEQARSLAAAALIQYHSQHQPVTTLDLHFLYVNEALQVLDMFLDHHIQALKELKKGRLPNNIDLYLITGRGLHSPFGPKVKPAVRHRLKQRGLRPSEQNPGLLLVNVSEHDKLTYEL